jgi:hypothetical protein
MFRHRLTDTHRYFSSLVDVDQARWKQSDVNKYVDAIEGKLAVDAGGCNSKYVAKWELFQDVQMTVDFSYKTRNGSTTSLSIQN